jgi:hypothetical protein
VNAPAIVTLDGLILHAERGDTAVVEPILADRYELNELTSCAVQPGDAVIDLDAHIAPTRCVSRLVGPTGHVTALGASARTSIVFANPFRQWFRLVDGRRATAASNVNGRAWPVIR